MCLLTNPKVGIAYSKGFKAGFVTEPFAKLEIRKPTNKLLVNVMISRRQCLSIFTSSKLNPCFSMEQHNLGEIVLVKDNNGVSGSSNQKV
jgi:hypothetical protein